MYECISGEIDPHEAIYDTELENLKIIPSHVDLVGAEVEMINLKDREKYMKVMLESLRKDYDYIIIDCCPSLGLITINSLTAADSIIIPVQCEFFALEGIAKLLSTIKLVKSKLNPSLEIEGFLLTMYDARTSLNRMVVEDVRKNFKEMVFDTIIQRNVRLSEAPSYGKPVITYDADSRGAINYMSLANEVIIRNSKNANAEA